MPHRKSKHRSSQPELRGQKQRDEESVRLVEAVLAERPVNTASLRKLAAVRGLVCDRLRRRAWPILLALPKDESDFDASYEALNSQLHRDSQVH